MKELAESLVVLGKKNGADEIDVSLAEGSEFSVEVRHGKIENLVEARSRIVSLRVIKDKKTAVATSSDLTRETLERLIKDAVKRAALANPDQFAGLPDYKEIKTDILSLELFDPHVAALDTKTKIDLAVQTERLALQDKRITNSHGATFETREITSILANSNGFSNGYEETTCSLGIGLQAGETDSRVEDYWYSTTTSLERLEKPEQIAKKAVERTVRQLNPRKIPTQDVPVIFEPMMTSWILGFLFSCISGVSVYRKTSFLAEKLGEKIGSEKVSIIDDGLLPGKLGSRPFDSEGVPAQKTLVIERGILKNFLCNTYAARKLKLQSTGNADGNSVGPNNFILQAGNASPENMIGTMDRGLILVRSIGHGLNPVTGDISRGAFGLWVENGEIVYPVSEITISGNLGKILQKIETIGNDLEFRSSFCGPTIKIQEMTVAGKGKKSHAV